MSGIAAAAAAESHEVLFSVAAVLNTAIYGEAVLAPRCARKGTHCKREMQSLTCGLSPRMPGSHSLFVGGAITVYRAVVLINSVIADICALTKLKFTMNDRRHFY